MGWYVNSSGDLTVAVIGWHTGALAKIVLLLDSPSSRCTCSTQRASRSRQRFRRAWS